MKIKKLLILVLATSLALTMVGCGSIGTSKKSKASKISSTPDYKNVKEYLTKRLEVPLDSRYESGKINNIYEYNYKVFDNNSLVVPLNAVYTKSEEGNSEFIDELVTDFVNKLGTVGDEYFQYNKESKDYTFDTCDYIKSDKVGEHSVDYFSVSLNMNRIKDGGFFHANKDSIDAHVIIGIIDDEDYTPNKNISAFAIFNAGYMYGLTDESWGSTCDFVAVADFIASLNGIDDSTQKYRLSKKSSIKITDDDKDIYFSKYCKTIISDTLGIDFNEWYKDCAEVLTIDDSVVIPVPMGYLGVTDKCITSDNTDNSNNMRMEVEIYDEDNTYTDIQQEIKKLIDKHEVVDNTDSIKISEASKLDLDSNYLSCDKIDIEMDATDYSTVYRLYSSEDSSINCILYVNGYSDKTKEEISTFFDGFVKKAQWLGKKDEDITRIIMEAFTHLPVYYEKLEKEN